VVDAWSATDIVRQGVIRGQSRQEGGPGGMQKGKDGPGPVVPGLALLGR
jgi:hypothetical protein